MKTRFYFFSLIFIGLAAMLPSCARKSSESNSQDSAREKRELTDDEVMQLAVKKWNEAINNRDYGLLERMYAPTVFIYTREMSGKEAAEVHRKALEEHHDFKQYIKGELEVVDLEDGSRKINYTKHTIQDGNGRDYDCYLIMTKIDGKWRISKESDYTTDENVRRRKMNVPSDAISGDFDGDGVTDHLWISGSKDSDGWYTSVRLKSDNPALESLSLPNTEAGSILVNAGKLNDSGKDYLGYIPQGAMGSWLEYNLVGFGNGSWHKASEPFLVWLGNDNVDRVRRSNKPGYITITYNTMNGVEPDFNDHTQTVPLLY